MAQITLQEAYNMLSIIGFLICMYKIYKLEIALKQVTTNQVLNSMANYFITKSLKDKGIISDVDIEIKIENNNE